MLSVAYFSHQWSLHTEFHKGAENRNPKVNQNVKINILWCNTVDGRHVEFGFAANLAANKVFSKIVNTKQQI